jgi:large subunit ribosomal protein L10
MKMNRTRKAELVKALATELQESPNLYLTDFTGIGVKPMTEFRAKLRGAGVRYRVVKNTLALQALEQASVTGLEDQITGPTAFVFAGEDPITAAKLLAEFQKEHDSLTVKAGLVEGRTVGPDEVTRLGTLPSREELMGQIGGALQSPLQGFVGALSGLLNQFVGAVEALRADRAAS